MVVGNEEDDHHHHVSYPPLHELLRFDFPVSVSRRLGLRVRWPL